MTDQHPITPLSELVELWITEVWHEGTPVRVAASDLHIATQAARWGADAELEACCEWLKAKAWIHPEFSDELRDARRPNPPSLKEQASESLDKVVECLKMLVPGASVDGIHIETIRRALEQLND